MESSPINTSPGSPSPPAEALHHLERAYELEAQDALAEALRSCDAALALTPAWAEAHNLRGIVLEALDRKLEAVAAYQEAVRLDPEAQEFQENLRGLEQDLAAERRERHQAQPPPPLAPGEDLVTVATYWYPLEAYLARTKLEWKGIWCCVADDYIITAYWLYANALGGVKLRVRQSDVPAALEALQPEPVNEVWLEEQVGPDDPRCPDCDSADVHFERLSLRGVYASWVLTAPVMVLTVNILAMIRLPTFHPPSAAEIVALFLVSVLSMGSGFPLPILKNRWKCNRCGAEWRHQKREEVVAADEGADEGGATPGS